MDTIEPVSSKTLVQRFGLKASAATVRSAMGALEQKGFLNQPHPSAGRVPTPQGYRHYVNCLLPPPSATVLHLEKELTNLSLKWSSLDDLLSHLARRLTDFTGLMSMITRPERSIPRLQEVRLVQSSDRLLVMLVENSNQAFQLNLRLPHKASNQLKSIETWLCSQLAKSEDSSIDWNSLPSELHLSGAILRDAIENHSKNQTAYEADTKFHGVSYLLAEPEFSNSESIRPLIELIDNQPTALIPSIKNQTDGIWIGAEHPQKELMNFSVIEACYHNSGNDIGHIALIGPMRMAYATAKAAVKAVAQHLNMVLS